MKTVINILVISLLILLYSCAIVKTPNGGEPDKNAPFVVNEFPHNKSASFTGNTVEISFDEYISLSNITSELVVSPPLNDKAVSSVKGKKLKISLPDGLKENTTYTLNFRNSITDITEGNILHNYKYIFSTGEFLDSLIIEGKVKDVESCQTVKNVKILLFDYECDSCIEKWNPLYVTQTLEDGSFRLENIRKGNYFLVGMEDINNNDKLENDEKVSFYNKPIKLDSNIKNIEQLLFIEELKDESIISAAFHEENHLKIVFNKPVKAKALEFYEDSLKLKHIIVWNKTKDSLDLWFEKKLDSIKINIVTEQNTFNNQIINYSVKEISGKILIYNDICGLTQSVLLISNVPIGEIDISKLLIYEGENKIEKQFNITEVNPLKYKIEFIPEKGKMYNIILEDSFARYINGSLSDSIKRVLITKGEEEVGEVYIFVVNNNLFPVIAQLISSTGIERRHVIINPLTSQELVFKNLVPEKLKVKFIEDINRNGTWDTGSLKSRLEPERIIYSDEIILRPNWEIKDLKFTLPIE